MLSRFLPLCLLVLPGRLLAAEPVDYVRDVKPLLKERCFACHGPLKQAAKLRLDTVAAMRKAGVIEAGAPDKSDLIDRIKSTDEKQRMPAEGKPLTAAQLDILSRWIAQGARAPADEKPELDPRKHWAFVPPERPAMPAVRNAAWVRNPVDAFILARLEEKGLTPAAPADRATLLRRVTLDLTGLPPTREELETARNDPSPDWYERTVDRLLASPRYAERWGRHWMDVWRYSDWYGSRYINELRNSRRHIWRWRDWIIESIEADKGYDRMVQEMLAADELAPGDLDAQRASGYLGRNFYVFNRHVWIQDTVENTSMAFLGLTFKCCRCHDHKFDPISQEDYYRLRAVFEPHRVRTDPLPGKSEKLKTNLAMGSPAGSDLKDGLDCVYDADVLPTYLLARGNEKDPVKDKPITPGVPEFLGGEWRIQPVSLSVESFYPALRPGHREAMLAEARTALRTAEAAAPTPLSAAQVATAKMKLLALEARIAAESAKYTQRARPDAETLALAAGRAEREANVAQAELDVLLARQLKTADAVQKLTAAKTKLEQARIAAAQATSAYTPLGPVYPATSSGRRLAFARWVTSRDNPLAARVAVNHVWLRHFGSALVPTPHNLGLNGKPPTHPELLDWLAVEFMEHGWSMKHLHRVMVTSATYRQSSTIEARNAKQDPENRLLWRANVRRMEGEVVRDTLLHLADRLDGTRGGEDLDPTTDAVSRRRSLYFRHTPDEKPLILELFDAANPSECFERTESIIPQQALALANGDFARSQARLIARRIGALSEEEFITSAFECLLARPPFADERERCVAFLARQAQMFAQGKGLTPAEGATTSAVPPASDPAARAREDLVHVLLSYNEFVTIR